MKIKVDKQIITEAVSNVSKAVSTKSTIPSLEGIYLSAKDDILYLSGYDLELGISTNIIATVEQEGSIILSAKLFLEMLKKLPAGEISIETDEKLMTFIKGSVTEYTILGISDEDYPELPKINDCDELICSQSILKSMIDQTLFAISTNDMKPVHTGSLFDIEENILTLVSVDGYRLAIRKEQLKSSKNGSFVVPGKTLQEVSKLMMDTNEEIKVSIGGRHIIFDINQYAVISRLIEGDFLDYRSALPNTTTTTIKISTKECIESIDRTSLLISDKTKSPLKVELKDNLMQLSCTTSIGKAYDEINCEMQGENVEMGFNNKYLLDALRHSQCDKIKLEINGALSPMKIVPLEGDSFLFLVLPVRLKNE